MIGWHKLVPNLKAPPLEVNGIMIEDTIAKAEALWTEVLGHFSADDDLDGDPLDNWDGMGSLAWEQTISLEEVEQSTIGVSSTLPGTDCVTVRLLKACWEMLSTRSMGYIAAALHLATSHRRGS